MIQSFDRILDGLRASQATFHNLFHLRRALPVQPSPVGCYAVGWRVELAVRDTCNFPGVGLLAAIFGALLLSSSCGSDPAGQGVATTTGATTDLKRAPTLIGYGPVNHWQEIEPSAFARLLAENGLTLTGIEYVWWWQPNTERCEERYGGGGGIRTDPARAREFVDAMRAVAVTTFINVVNWNACGPRNQEQSWFAARMQDVLDVVGSEGVMLEAVSEFWMSPTEADAEKAFDWTKFARGVWTGLFVLPSDGPNSDTPRWAIPYDFLDVHYCSDEALIAGLRQGDAKRLHSTDCSPIVNPGPERAARFTREALENGTNLFIYGFTDDQPDAEVVAAMGREIQRLSQVPAGTPSPSPTRNLPAATPTPTASASPIPTPTPAASPSPTPPSILSLPLPPPL